MTIDYLTTLTDSKREHLMAFESLPLTVRDVRASEEVLRRIYNAARKGLKGDTLARVAGLSPIEYRRLCEMDPIAEEAAGWGYADAEYAAANAIQTAIDAGDAKIALDYLKHRADWVAKQQITIDNYTSISITDALGAARERMITIEAVPNATDKILSERGTDAYGGALEPPRSEQPRELCDVQFSVGASGDAAGEFHGAAPMATQSVAGNGRTHRRKQPAPSV